MFKLWSEKNNDAKKMLSPNLDQKNWDDLSSDDKGKIWNFLQYWFKEDGLRIFISIINLNEEHKFRSYANLTLENPSKINAFYDFKEIFYNENQHVVLELLSCFCQSIVQEREDKNPGIYKSNYDSTEEYVNKLTMWRFEEFDKFASRINDIFGHFNINLILTREGFIERQDSKIVEEIYIPVLNFLSFPKWNDVNRELGDAFKEYQEKTDPGYSNCVTHAISALQAFLQILVNGKIGSSDGINYFIKLAQEKNLIPSDKFSSEVFKNIETILMRERGKTGDAHPKLEYANEKNARLVLNLIMIFIQHCIQN